MSASGNEISLFRIAALAVLVYSTPASNAFAEPMALVEPTHRMTTIFDPMLRDQKSVERHFEHARSVADPRLRRQIVVLSSGEAPGTVIIDTPNTYRSTPLPIPLDAIRLRAAALH